VTLYSAWNAPAGTHYDLDATLAIATDPGAGADRFFAAQFALESATSDGGYIGLQTDATRPDGTTGKIAIVSIWNAVGATAGANATCNTFGGEGVGWSCRVAYDWHEGHAYRLRLWALSKNSWSAWVRDETSMVEVYIGKIDTPAADGWLTGGTTAFTEYYGPSFPACTSLKKSVVTWSNPTVDDGVPTTFASNSAGKGACASVRAATGSGPTSHAMGI
jgi:hypothetical protein